MNSEQPKEGKHYLGELSHQCHYPNEDPANLELEQTSPEHVWNQHLPSEFIIERMEHLNAHLMEQNPELAKNISELELPPQACPDNEIWQQEWKKEIAAVKEGLKRQLKPYQDAESRPPNKPLNQ